MPRTAATVSSILADLPRTLPAQPRLDDLMAVLAERGFGLTLAAAAVPAVIPTPGVPAGMVFGSVLAVIGMAMIAGGRNARLPGWLGRLKLSRALLDVLERRGLPLIRWIERRSEQRFQALAGPAATPWLGLATLLMGVLIALPIPFGNTIPGFAVLLIGAGLALRDGAVVAAGLGMAMLGAAVSVVLIVASYEIVKAVAG